MTESHTCHSSSNHSCHANNMDVGSSMFDYYPARRSNSSSGTHYDCSYLKQICISNSLLLLILMAVLYAAINPPVGLDNGPLASRYTMSYGATMGIFFIMGLSLKVSELRRSGQDLFFALKLSLLQMFNLLFIPSFAFLLVLLLQSISTIDMALLNGIMICTCLPTSISMCVVLTLSSNGSEIFAIAMASIGNLVGVLTTPFAVSFFLSSLLSPADSSFGQLSADSIRTIYFSLLLKVFIPVLVGVALKLNPITRISNPVNGFVTTYKKELKFTQEILLALIVYRVWNTNYEK